MKIKKIENAIGNTNVIEINGIYIKLEASNPGGSIKDRAVKGMLEKLIQSGQLKPGGTIVEPSSGNTGIALAMLGRSMGHPIVITMPETMSIERRSLIQSFGAKLVLTEGAKGMKGAIGEAEKLVEENEGFVMLGQFDNPGNPESHYNTTGLELISDFEHIDYFVAGVGTGGTLSGVGKRLKEKFPNIKIIAVEPFNSPVISGGSPSPHKIQGIGAGFIPQNLDRSIIDQIITIKDEEAFEGTRELLKVAGVHAGISSGANYIASLKLKEQVGKDKIIVTVSPDGGIKYISMNVFE